MDDDPTIVDNPGQGNKSYWVLNQRDRWLGHFKGSTRLPQDAAKHLGRRYLLSSIHTAWRLLCSYMHIQLSVNSVYFILAQVSCMAVIFMRITALQRDDQAYSTYLCFVNSWQAVQKHLKHTSPWSGVLLAF